MITSQQAQEIIGNTKINLTTVECKLADALGKVLAENIIADRDFPAFNRVSMDGIAIKFTENGTTFYSNKTQYAVGHSFINFL